MVVARLVGFLSVLLVALVTHSAHAETMKVQCIQANTNAQSLRRDGKLAEAREKLRFCSQSKCPELVATDCVKRLDELESAQPTVVFDAADTSGRPVNDVAVSMDGKPLVQKLTGAAVEVDLGEHLLVFSAEGRPHVEQRLVFREGEKARRLHVVLEPAPGSVPAAVAAVPTGESPSEPASSAAPAPVEPEPSGAQRGSTQRTAGYIVGGVGLAGLVVGGIFGYLTIQDKQRQTDNCSSKTQCSDYDEAVAAHEDAKTRGTVATVAFVAGAAAIAGGLVLVLTAPRTPSNTASRSLTLHPMAGPGGARLTMTAAF